MMPPRLCNRSSADLFLYTGMQVLDDIRDSTRTAAIGFTKVLAHQINRACTPETATVTTGFGNSAADTSVAGTFLGARDRKRKRDEDITNSLEATTAVIIPILLDKGLVAGSQEGRGFSLGLLVQVVKVVNVDSPYTHFLT